MAFDVSDIINDPDFATTFTVLRTTGAFAADGKWQGQEQELPVRTGITLPAQLDELQVLPEGERNKETIAVYCVDNLLMGDQQQQQPDIIKKDGKFYKVAFTRFYEQCSLWYALCTRFYRDDT